MSMKLLITLLFLAGAFQLRAQDTLRSQGYTVVWDTLRMKEKPEWKRHFDEANVSSGTFVLFDQQRSKYFVYNRQRMVNRYLPASTFKIPHSLIALETAVVKSTSEKMKWDGFDKGNANWNMDQSMKSAFMYSTIWYYQECAKKIGFKRMQEYIDLMSYGNKNLHGGIDNFWLKGKLRISAKEQVDLLKKLQTDNLAFKPEVMKAVKEIMIEEENKIYILRAKTGWAEQDGKHIGWYVGYVEKPKKGKDAQSDFWYFALNIDMDPNHPEMRKQIALRILSEVKAI